MRREELQGCRVARSQSCKVAELQGRRVAELQGRRVAGSQSCRVAELQGQGAEMLTQTKIDNYTALTQGAALQLRPGSGVLRLTGDDRADFLQRMTTNDIKKLKPSESTVTVLTSPVARVLFAFTVIYQEDELLLLPSAGEAEALSQHLRGQIFFMDNVKVANVSAEFVRSRLMGPSSGAILADVGVALASADDGAVMGKAGAIFVSQQRYDVPGFEVLVPVEDQESWLEKLSAAGAHQLEDDIAYTARRVELGRPLPGFEVTEAHSPLESGLAWTCAEDKGCYTGQEIIARQITYDKVTKTLVGLRSDAALAAGASVTLEGKSVGAVTSVADIPATDGTIALAIIKRPQNEAGTALTVGDAAVEVVALPFG